MIDEIIRALDEPSIAIVRMITEWDGYYKDGHVRINKHSRRPYECVLIHEMLHHLYPKKSERWVRAKEDELWLNITRQQHATLSVAIRKIMRRKK